MLHPEYLSTVAEPLVEIYAELQMRIQTDIARRISESGKATATAEWQAIKVRQLGMAQQSMQREIAKALGVSEQDVARLFRAAGLKSMQSDKALQRELIKAGRLSKDIAPIGASEAFKQVMTANARRTLNTLKRLTGTIAIDATGKLNQYMDMAQMMTQSGAFTHEQSVKVAVERFAADGVYAFDYFSGVRTSIEAAVRRALVTGINQATAEISLANAEELGTDLVEVTSHRDARPSHAAWQGGVYSISGNDQKYKGLVESTGYGTGPGLAGWSCRHSFFAYVDGISEQLPKEEYSQETYEQEQESRYNERNIRAWKRRAATLEAGGQDATKAREKVKAWQKKQREHIAKTGLTREYVRERIYGKPG